MKSVLVVEPDAGLSFLMCESLRGAGFEAVPCPPQQAAALAAERGAAAVVLALSSAESGEESPLYRALRADPRTSAVPLVLCTGRGDATVRRKVGERPPRVLFKPFTPEELVAAVVEAAGGA